MNGLESTLMLRTATLDDYDSLMEMSQGLYDGWDYLPHVYKNWIRQEQHYGDRVNLGKCIL